MKRRNDIEQGTEAWHRARWGRVGGTTSSGLLVKTDTLMLTLVGEQTEDFALDTGFKSKAMEEGSEKEPEARKRLNKYLGIELKEVGLLDSEECELLFISPDGITDCDTISCEIKSPGSKKHIETCLADEIPSDNIKQCIHYFTINPKLEKHYFCSFRPESNIKPLFVKELTRASMINIGTKARPKMESVGSVAERSLHAARELEVNIKQAIEQLKF